MKKITAFLLTLVMLLGLLPMSVLAAEIAQPEIAQSAALSKAPEVKYSEEGYPLSYIDLDTHMEFPASLSKEDSGVKKGTTPLPSALSNADIGWVKDQNPYGTCWAFGATAVSEASLGGTQKLSALQLAYYGYQLISDPLGNADGEGAHALLQNFAAGETFLDCGGNTEWAMWSLANWTTATADNNLEYDNSYDYDNRHYVSGPNLQAAAAETLGANNYERTAIVKNIDYIEYGTDTTHRDAVKQAIVDCGAVTVSYYHNSGYYNSEYGYYYSNTSNYSNHAVEIVGWNDDFPAAEFKNKGLSKPKGDGAWLVRNSWDADWGTDGDTEYGESYAYYESGVGYVGGYFWLSYYDTSICDIYALYMQSAETYDNNYQYDGSTYDGSFTSVKHRGMAALYTINGTDASPYQEIGAIGFGTHSADVSGKVYLYKGATASNLTGGTLLNEGGTAFSFTYPGYHTVEIPDTIAVEGGDKISVVIIFDQAVSVSVSYSLGSSNDWVNFIEYAYYNETFLSSNGTSWSDAASSGVTARVKMFTTDGSGTTYTVTYDANGGSDAPSVQTTDKGTPTTIGAAPTAPAGGWTFAGWAKSKTATAADYQPGASYSGDKNLKLYAVWQKSITMDANNGSLDSVPASLTKTRGVALTLPTEKPSKTDCTFVGWSASSDATAASYAAGGKMSSDEVSTLYAVWKNCYLRITEDTARVPVKGTVNLTDEASGAITWTTSDKKVATVSGGTVKGVKAGTCTIRAALTEDPSIYDECTVTVIPAVKKLVISTKKANIVAGDDLDVTVTASPDGTEFDIVPQGFLQDGDVFTNDGIVITRTNGTDFNIAVPDTYSGNLKPKITFADTGSGKSVALTLTIAGKAQGIELNVNETQTIASGKSLTLKATLTPTLKEDLIWESSDPSVATVTNKGKVKGVGPGTCTITVTSTSNETVSDSVYLIVTPVLKGVKGQKVSLTTASSPINLYDYVAITWKGAAPDPADYATFGYSVTFEPSGTIAGSISSFLIGPNNLPYTPPSVITGSKVTDKITVTVTCGGTTKSSTITITVTPVGKVSTAEDAALPEEIILEETEEPEEASEIE